MFKVQNRTEANHSDPDEVVVPAKPAPPRYASPRIGTQGCDDYYYDEIGDPFNRQLESCCPGSGAHCV